jgi:hypothetical protein
MPVRIEDVIVPESFDAYMAKNTMQTNALYGAGVMRTDSNLAGKLAGGGRTFNVPFWKDLDDTESDPGSDDPDSHAIPGAITTGRDVAIRQFRTKGWSTMNLTAELAGSDPMQAIGNRVNAYWDRQFDRITIATVNGVINDNIANDSGDMVNDISMDTAGTPATSNLFSAEAVMDTAQTMGDAKNDLKLIVMHSVVHNRLAKQQLIDFRPDADGKRWWSYFQDYRVHVSDNLTPIQGTNQLLYRTFLFGADAIGWALSSPDKPVEVDSVPSAGDGAGMETLWTRRQFAIHPYGIKWTDTSVGGLFPTNTELALAANWDRVYPERKMIPIAALITNG